MPSDEAAFRLVCASAIIPVWAIREFYRYRGGQSFREVLRASKESRSLTRLLVLLALLFFSSTFAYIFFPALISTATVPLPSSIRWAGAVCCWAGTLGQIWTHLSLDRQFSGILRIRKDHLLITNGPYAWVRHPMYSFGLLLNIGLALVSANWLVFASGTALIVLAMIARTPNEETMLIDAFGDSYREYMRRTGRFIPRLRTG